MNYMAKVAKMLGVELGERFKIRLNNASGAPEMPVDVTYQLDNFGVTCSYDGISCETTLDNILNGTYELVKLPWKPKEGGRFYSMRPNGTIDCFMFFPNHPLYVAALAFGNCFRTKAEAEAHKDEILQKMKEVLEG